MMRTLFLVLLSFGIVKSEVNHTFITQYGKFNVPDLKYIYSNYDSSSNVSVECSQQLEVLPNETIATMLDATSKFPWPGLGYGTKADYGNYDQCMTVDYNYPGGRILGKHCTMGLLIPDPLNTSTYYTLAVCKPDACSASDFNILINSTIENFPFTDNLCQTIETDKDFTASDVVTIVIFLIVILLMILSTTYDIYLHKTNSKSHHTLLLAFSVLSNGKKLLHVSSGSSKEQIQTFHGLRTISMMWIVAGHGFSGWQTANVMNLDDKLSWLYKRYAGYIATSPLAVDTFFYISGFLLAFQYLKQKPKPLKAQVMSVPHMYIHRYLRLTPAMLMIYLVTISVYKHFGSGPLYSYGAESFAKPCRDNWWQLFLYLQNYLIDFDDMCLGPTWYLSADMQMFLLAPLILIPLSLNMKKSSGFMLSMVELLILNLLSTFIPMAIKLLVPDYTNEYDTHSRFIDFFLGMMLATFMRLKMDKPFLHMVKRERVSITNLIVWIVILLGMTTTLVCYQEVEMNHGYDSKSVFYSLMRPAWCIGLSWIVYSCYHGYGGIVNWILSAPMMQVMGRLTYCIYLLHISVEGYYIIITREKKYFSDYNVFYMWCGTYTMTALLAIFWTLAFESPLIIIEKYVLGGGNKSNRGKPPQNGA